MIKPETGWPEAGKLCYAFYVQDVFDKNFGLIGYF